MRGSQQSVSNGLERTGYPLGRDNYLWLYPHCLLLAPMCSTVRNRWCRLSKLHALIGINKAMKHRNRLWGQRILYPEEAGLKRALLIIHVQAPLQKEHNLSPELKKAG